MAALHVESDLWLEHHVGQTSVRGQHPGIHSTLRSFGMVWTCLDAISLTHHHQIGFSSLRNQKSGGHLLDVFELNDLSVSFTPPPGVAL